MQIGFDLSDYTLLFLYVNIPYKGTSKSKLVFIKQTLFHNSNCEVHIVVENISVSLLSNLLSSYVDLIYFQDLHTGSMSSFLDIFINFYSGKSTKYTILSIYHIQLDNPVSEEHVPIENLRFQPTHFQFLRISGSNSVLMH